MRKYYWYITSYTKKHGLVILLSVVLAIIVFSLFIPTLFKSLDSKRRFYIGVIGQYSLENLPENVSSLISSGLTIEEPDGTVRPGLAERWIIENDGKTYRFVIKENLKWQDGLDVTPDTISYSLEDVEILTTPHDVIFKLPDAFVPFPSVVSQPVLRYINERYLFFFRRKMPIGVGNYQVVNYKLDNNKLDEIVLDSPQERRVYRFYFTEDQAVTAFKNGEIDILPDLTSRHDIFDWDTVQVTENIRTDRYLAVFFDNNNPVFDRNTRKALSYALPKPTDDTRAVGPISVDSWAYLDGARGYEYDMDRAIERMLDPVPGVPITFTLTTTSTFQDEAEDIKQSWEEFGNRAFEACQASSNVQDKATCDNVKVQVNIRINNFPDTNNFEALLVGQETPADPDQYPLWHSEQSTNFTHYKNTRIDALLERGRTTADAAERLAIYQEFQQFFLEDAPAVFIRYLNSYTAERK